MTQIFVIKLENGASLEVRAEAETGVKLHDNCVFNRDFFSDIGEVQRELPTPTMTANPAELPLITRIATQEDLMQANANVAKARSAMRTAQRYVDDLQLTMNLVNAHYTLDAKLVTIQFSADGRVDFRELVKELSRALSTRIELRQIGVRDETGIHGGIAVCGQPLCCCRYLKEFNSINVKMAKEQDLSLTPATISGVCGRLKCCLKFEHEGYLELEKTMPRRGEFCETPAGRGKITDRHLLTQKVTVTFEGGNSQQFPVEEIKVLDRRTVGNGAFQGGNRNERNDRNDRNERNERGERNRGDRNNRNDRNEGGNGAPDARNEETSNRRERIRNRRERRNNERSAEGDAMKREAPAQTVPASAVTAENGSDARNE